MKVPAARGGAAASYLLALALGATASGQDPARTTDAPSMQRIGDAYRQLQQAALSALQEKARAWKEEDEAPAATQQDDASPARNAQSPGSGLTLRSEELLIAACPDGLLAGAPSASSASVSKAQPPGSSGDQRDDDRATPPPTSVDPSGQGGGRTVGLVLVCSHSPAPAGAVGDGQGQSDKQAKEAGSTRDPRTAGGVGTAGAPGPLKPGVYCVKQSGNSVWLADQGGQVVLRANLDGHGKAPGDASAGQHAGQDDRQAGAAPPKAMHEADWEHVFGALAEEVMVTMGWTENSASSSSAR